MNIKKVLKAYKLFIAIKNSWLESQGIKWTEAGNLSFTLHFQTSSHHTEQYKNTTWLKQLSAFFSRVDSESVWA